MKSESRESIFAWYRRIIAMLLLAIVCAAAGCTSPSKSIGTWAGPSASLAYSIEPWPYVAQPSSIVRTAHYKIYTTIEDQDFLKRTAQLMEGALDQYRQLAPGVTISSAPMECYLFASRSQWASYTRQTTGSEAKIYLQINRGGYTLRDRYVAYFIGDNGTWSVASHEGWHQFLSRNLKGRLPPFLEEGLATTFEAVEWDGDLPRWNRSINRSRCAALRHAIDSKNLWPLEKLVTLHAGNVVTGSGEQIDAFYAQNWAFAKFLWESDGGKYRADLQRLILDTANGTVHDPTGTLNVATQGWNPAGVKPMLEFYLGKSLAEIDVEYQAYIRKVAYEELNGQFEMQ